MNPVDATAATKAFGDFMAVSEADLHVEAGEVVGLLGANGAGKTTLIRMILGLLAPTSGQIRLWGRPQSRQQRRRIGYVPQNLGLYADLSAAENLDFRADVFGVESAAPGGMVDAVVASLPLGVQRRAAFFAATRISSCWTSRPPGCHRWRGATCGISSIGGQQTAWASWSRRTTWTRRNRPTGS